MMLSWSFSQQRRSSILFGITALVLVSILSLYYWLPDSRLHEYLPQWKPLPSNDLADSSIDSSVDNLVDNSTLSGVQRQETLGWDTLPEYNLQPYDTPFCQERYGRTYLEKLHESSTGLCTSNSQTNMTCFHSKMSDSRVDMFCLGKSAVFDPKDRKFALGCEQRTLSPEENDKGIPSLSSLSSYWYGTGPRVLFDKAVKLDNNVEPSTPTPNYTILLKREGAYNVWHCLMEIWSLTMSLDVLRTTKDPSTNSPFFSTDDAENTQILILDEQDDGPYFHLWTMFAKKPILRIKDLPDNTKVENVILPLAGASNPLWQGDWDIHACEKSELLHTFTHRVLTFHKIDSRTAPHKEDLVLTYIDRKESRRLIDAASYLEELKATVPHLKTQMIDFTAISFAEQLKVVQETDILMGVHGAGLTHGMFLREGSVMVEILPENLTYKGFRNLAGLAGNIYISAHGVPLPTARAEGGNKDFEKRDWHIEDVYIEKERFMDMMKVAVKTLYNKGNRNYDVV